MPYTQLRSEDWINPLLSFIFVSCHNAVWTNIFLLLVVKLNTKSPAAAQHRTARGLNFSRNHTHTFRSYYALQLADSMGFNSTA